VPGRLPPLGGGPCCRRPPAWRRLCLPTTPLSLRLPTRRQAFQSAVSGCRGPAAAAPRGCRPARPDSGLVRLRLLAPAVKFLNRAHAGGGGGGGPQPRRPELDPAPGVGRRRAGGGPANSVRSRRLRLLAPAVKFLNRPQPPAKPVQTPATPPATLVQTAGDTGANRRRHWCKPPAPPLSTPAHAGTKHQPPTTTAAGRSRR
jgi:hypothetical protein